jgi:acetoin utilization protein AcuB
MIPKDKYSTSDFKLENPIFVEAEDTVSKVYQLMQRERIRHVPVLEKGKPVGVISDRDVKFVSYASGVVEMTAKTIMSDEVFSIKEGEPVKEAILNMWEKKIGSTIITDSDGHLTGIITASDALRMLAESMS